MSMTTLILIVVIVSALCIAMLWIFQIKRQRAIERARKTIIYNSQISQIQQVVEETALFLDNKLLAFLAGQVDAAIKGLVKNKIQPDKHCQNIQEQSLLWINDAQKIRQQALTKKSEGQQKRLLLLKNIIQYIRQSVSRNAISRKEAKSLASSTKLSKVKLFCHYYQQDIDQAVKEGNAEMATLSIKKMKGLLAQLSSLPQDLEEQLSQCNKLLEQQQKTIKESKANNDKRLEEEFDKQEEIDQDWQKKQHYD